MPAALRFLIRATMWTRVVSMAGPITFIDEWDVDAPQEIVFDAVADSRTYQEWFTVPSIEIDAEGPPEMGRITRARFKARLPLTFELTTRIVRLDRPHELDIEVEGDLGGKAVWTFTPHDGRVHVTFDWRSYPKRRLLRYLTPILRPLFRWNHRMAMRQCKRNLEPFARRQAGLTPR